MDNEGSIEVPVRTCTTVSPGGGVRKTLTVFCPVERRSLDPRICARCDLCASMPVDVEAPSASLRCVTPRLSDRPRARPWFVGRDAAAGSVPVGALVGRSLLCAHGGAPAQFLRAVFDRHTTSLALVVDDDERVVGAASRAEIVLHRGLVADVMDLRVPRVPESAPLSEAITPMAYGRVRAIAVLGENERPVGFVTELDVLRWVARRGTP